MLTWTHSSLALSAEDTTLSEQGSLHGQGDAMRFIRENMRVAPVPLLPEILLYTAHPASGLWRLAGPEADGADLPPPYWAYQWAGGAVLARHFLDRPETVRGRRVLDLGAGSGVVGIAAAKAGASQVIAAEIDPHGGRRARSQRRDERCRRHGCGA